MFISRLTSVLERPIQIELYRVLKNLVAKKFSFNDIEFVGVKFEPTINGRPDLVVEAIERGKKLNLLVIETKRKVPFIDHKFDPYSTDVIKQASGYANSLGAPYFATCNGEVLVLFKTFEVGVPLLQRKLKHYRVSFDEEFAKTILEEVCRFEVGLGKWLELDDVFLHRLRTFHDSITPLMLESVNKQLNEDFVFKWRYRTWLKSQFFEYSPKMSEVIAEQLAWVFMNRLTFYKTLETQIPDLQKLRKVETEDPREFQNTLKALFERVCKNVDYEPIFKPHDILDHVLLPKKLIYVLNDFIEELGTYDLAKIRSDVIGRVYEELIPDAERHRLGQYYTPPPVIELITRLCIKSPNDKILDPACGSGGFLVKAYHKLKDFKKKENAFADEKLLHEEILDQLYGIDINAFPAQLSTINLAVRNLNVTSRNINVVVHDFFKVKPSTEGIPKELDAVVTNPPFTRQEEVEYKDQIRKEALTYSDGTKIDIGAQAGIYAYFFTHSAKFLKNGGMMGYITSNTWLDVSFGEGLKQFFLDHFKLLAIVEFDSAVFGTALVNTCVSILEKEEDSHKRQKNIVRFVRLKKAIEIGKIVETILFTSRNYEDERIRVVIKSQGTLQRVERWGNYLRAPAIYFKVISHNSITSLGKKVRIRRGITTGSNGFFILDKEKARLWNMEPQFLEKVISSFRGINHTELMSKDISECVLMVHEPKENLKQENVLRYLEYGENLEITTKRGTRVTAETIKGVNNLSTCKGRKIWYDLGRREKAPILFPYLTWEHTRFIFNQIKVNATDVFQEIYPFNEDELVCLLGFLNSTLTSFLLELHGRSYGGGVLKTQTYELETLPILDPEKLSKSDRQKIETKFLRICEAENKGDKNAEHKARIELDNAVFDALELKERERQHVYEGLESLRRMRLQRKEVDVLVETAEKWKPHKKPKKEKIAKSDPSKRLDVWINTRTTA